jgi:MFS family permease
VTKENYGRAFGSERMMDTCGAIVGPASAVALLAAVNHYYPTLFAWALVPGLLATVLIAFVVVEKERQPVKHISFGESLRALPKPYRKFLVAVELFGAGDFAHSMLILLAALRLTPTLGAAKAASIAVGLDLLHNVLYAAFAFVAGWLADRFDKRRLLASGYALAAVMDFAIIVLPVSVWALALVFAVGGIYVAVEETLEDSLCAELVDEAHHGMAFGTLATVKGGRCSVERGGRRTVDLGGNNGGLRLLRGAVHGRSLAGAAGSQR